MRHSWQGQKAFTLIEFIIVFILVGLLASVALPRYLGMREEAKVAALKDNLKSIRSAIDIFHSRQLLRQAQDPNFTGNLFPTVAELTTPGVVIDKVFPSNPFTEATIADGLLVTNNADILTLGVDKSNAATVAIDADYGWWYSSGSGQIIAASLVLIEGEHEPIYEW